MLERLLTEQRNSASTEIDRLSTLEMLRVINDEDRLVAEAVSQVLPAVAQAVDAVANAIRSGGRLYYIGAGTSGRLGVLDASECPPTYGCPPDMVQGIMAGGESALARASEASEDDPDSGARDLIAAGFREGDVLCGIAASGRTPYVLGAVDKARAMGCVTIGISCVPGSALSEAVAIAIAPVTGPEVITGSTRMKAGTATKLVLNMLTTGAMIRLGYTFGNLMVNVQPKNAKLVDRAERIVMEAGEVERPRAAELLKEAGMSVRAAIVMARLKVGRAEAEQRLRENGNVVARVMEAHGRTGGRA
ncbi:MAG: N-acetylmuramic acid 6-phosphate etherase [Bryobacterales bacterium]|nr:N-acetylmuramic acid 6-phosphate etherase [Bryobacterales bacterium]